MENTFTRSEEERHESSPLQYMSCSIGHHSKDVSSPEPFIETLCVEAAFIACQGDGVTAGAM